MKPSSFCTMCTSTCKQELIGFLLSLSIHHRDEKVYVICDTLTKETIENMSIKIRLDIVWLVSLDKFSNMNRSQMEQQGIWSDFQMMKAVAIEKALEKEKDVLFLDSDIIILDEINDIDPDKELGVSPQFIKQKNVDETGYYNGGMLWTNQKSLPNDWKEFTKTSRYFDQASIEDLERKYDSFEFGDNYNLQTWRFIIGKEDTNTIISYLNIKENKIFYKDKPLKFIHTHFNSSRFKQINDFFINLLTQAGYYRELVCIGRLINEAWVINSPKQPLPSIFRHKNDSFRELMILWKVKNKDIKIEYSKEEHVWLRPNLLLYDRPTLEWMNNNVMKCSIIYLGNGSMKNEGEKLNRELKKIVKPWIFWPRRPMVLEKVLKDEGILGYDERSCNTIFIGNFENSVQERYRDKNNWESVLDEYHCTKGSTHKFTQKEYLMKLRSSRYGLCLRGYGSKCHREVELMAFGTVPVVTSEVSIVDYYDPPIINTHYLLVKDEEDLKSQINEIGKERWREMSEACAEWYKRNVHSDNSWKNFINNVIYN